MTVKLGPSYGRKYKLKPRTESQEQLQEKVFQVSLPCRSDPESWFAEEKEIRQIAALVCREECTLLKACHAVAVKNNEKFGVWGGHDHTTMERRKRNG